jgi:L-threonylcarbamoyladenylate synthase
MAVMLSGDDPGIERAARAIREGKLAAFPTETVYGLGADAFNTRALAQVFEVKERPRFDPLIVHIADIGAVSRIADLEKLAPETRRLFFLLAETFWPGPLTLILPKRDEVPDLATGGLPSVALRFPAHPAAQRLIVRSTGAIAAPSANRFGRLSPTAAAHVQEQLGDRIDFIIDGGAPAVGIESTVLDIAPAGPGGGRPRILRPGGVSREALEALTGPVAENDAAGSAADGAALPSPGLLKSHYAPRTPLVLHSAEEMASFSPGEKEGLLFFSGKTRAAREARYAGERFPAITLSESGDSTEGAARFFSALHALDGAGLRLIHAETAPESGLGRAINDRLRRASVRR